MGLAQVLVSRSIAKKLSRTVGTTLRQIKSDGAACLKTGAKLFWSPQTGEYFVSGYAHDGRDATDAVKAVGGRVADFVVAM